MSEGAKQAMVSIVIPTYNEEGSLEQLHREIADTARASGIDLEMIFVDDGSRDGSWARIEALASADSRVRAIKFRRNFGKAAALSAGFAAASGDIVITMDADLQDSPSEIPNLTAKINEGWDLVSGWKKRRHDPWHKTIPSRVFNWIVSSVSRLKLHDHNCGLKAYRADVTKEIRLYGEMHRFATVLAHARGFKVTEVPVEHRKRIHGKSKYGVSRFIKGLLDLLTVRFLTGYGERPLHFMGGVGLTAFFLGLLGLGYLAVIWCMGHRPIGTRPILVYSVAALLVGAQMIAVGILAEMIASRSVGPQGTCESSSYSVEKRIG